MESFSAPDWRGAALNPPFCFGPNSAAAPLHRETIFAALKAGGKYFWRGGGTKKKTGRGGEKKKSGKHDNNFIQGANVSVAKIRRKV